MGIYGFVQDEAKGSSGGEEMSREVERHCVRGSGGEVDETALGDD